MKIKTLLFFTSLFLFLSCQNSQTKRLEEIGKLSEAVVQPEEAADHLKKHPYLIKDDSFFGVSVGQKIDLIKESKVEKSTIENGEGTFLIYYIVAKSGTKLAYFYPDPVDKTLVGNIIVTSKAAFTIDLIEIGKSFGDVKKRVSNYEVHGSEIESKTNVFIGNIRLELDFPSNKYDLNESEIPNHAKVKQIWISK